MNGEPVIAIDGPVGAGKGEISRRVAERLGFHLLDSGAIYRAFALASLRGGIALGDTGALQRLAATLVVRFECGSAGGAPRTLLDGKDVDHLIRGEECWQRASRLAANPAVRPLLLGLQRGFRRLPGLVADGRDMGSVVFPDAPLKVYLTASTEERARRRHEQLMAKGADVSFAHLLGEIRKRDRRDRERSLAPLRPAENAIVMDTTAHGIEAVVEKVLAAADARGIAPPTGMSAGSHVMPPMTTPPGTGRRR